MRRTLTLRLAAGVVGLGLIAAACGDDSDDDSAADTTAAEETTTTVEQSETTSADEDSTETSASEAGEDDAAGADAAAEGDIVEVAVAAGDFTTLATALEAAGLVETLQGEGPFTVFAPTDAAFEALPAGTLDELLADQEALTNVLTYHVVEGEVPAADVVNLTEATALNGDTITISVQGEDVILNDSVQVVTTDVEASNGVIHVIDAVLLPPSS